MKLRRLRIVLGANAAPPGLAVVAEGKPQVANVLGLHERVRDQPHLEGDEKSAGGDVLILVGGVGLGGRGEGACVCYLFLLLYAR